jgi:hypothetical protein
MRTSATRKAPQEMRGPNCYREANPRRLLFDWHRDYRTRTNDVIVAVQISKCVLDILGLARYNHGHRS